MRGVYKNIFEKNLQLYDLEQIKRVKKNIGEVMGGMIGFVLERYISIYFFNFKCSRNIAMLIFFYLL